MPSLRDRFLIYAAAFVRSLAIGLCGVLLALHLNALGWDVRQTGLLVTAGLAGIALATLLTGLLADRARRFSLIALGVLQTLGGLALVFSANYTDAPGVLLAFAFFGMINGLGRDRGPAYALEQALLPSTTTDAGRTWTIAWYSLLMDAGLALGSLAAGVPYLLRHTWGWPVAQSYQAAWWTYTALAVIALALYASLSPAVEAVKTGKLLPRMSLPPKENRPVIYKLAALTGMDSLGGGFLSSTLVAYWFFHRFGAGEELLGPIFFGARVANAASHLVAAWLARKIGLLNTMVFTHLPSSIFLIAVPFAPSLPWAIALFLAREGLVEMDVPTRQSYILAVVQPEERAFASGMTTFTRNLAYAIAPAFAGAAMKALSMASPLFFGGGIKIAYDVTLYTAFRRVRPPEERTKS
ncbi:MAG TPA: MFS transporter [Candidatus Acidoferrales bacterium]|nr:MFS transporter [Candidatus Acidoferrales bacterium]